MKKLMLPLIRLFVNGAIGTVLLASIWRIEAQTIDVYVNSSTWAFVTAGGTGTLNVGPVTATSQVSPYEQRKYYGGSFDTVVIRSHVSPYTVLQTLTSCYNVFYTSGTTAYKLSNNYNGSGNGLTGEVFALARSLQRRPLHRRRFWARRRLQSHQ